MPKKKRSSNKKGKRKGSEKKIVCQQQQQNVDAEDEATREERKRHEVLAVVYPHFEAAWQRRNKIDGGRGITEEDKEAAQEEVDGLVKEDIINMLKDVEYGKMMGFVEEKMTDEEKVAADLHDQALFGNHPQPNDCGICFLPLPLRVSERTYKLCCGEVSWTCVLIHLTSS